MFVELRRRVSSSSGSSLVSGNAFLFNDMSASESDFCSSVILKKIYRELQ